MFETLLSNKRLLFLLFKKVQLDYKIKSQSAYKKKRCMKKKSQIVKPNNHDVKWYVKLLTGQGNENWIHNDVSLYNQLITKK